MEEIKEIDYKTAIDFLLPKHYSGRKPQVTKAFGLYEGDQLLAVCTFGKPALRAFVKEYLEKSIRKMYTNLTDCAELIITKDNYHILFLNA